MPILKKPVINYFRSNTNEEILANEQIIVEWEVEGAKKVRLDGMTVEASGAQSFFLDTTTNFELSASNHFGTVSEQITIRLSDPLVVSFESESSVIKEGEAINVFFQLKNAMTWKLEANYKRLSSKTFEVIGEGKLDRDAPRMQQHVSFIPKGACELILTAKNGRQAFTTGHINLYERALALEMFTEKNVVKARSTVRVSWKTQHASRIFLNPGNIDVSNFDFYDFPVEGNHDIVLELKANGDFHQQVVCDKTLFLAKIDKPQPFNSQDPEHPKFFLRWSATGVSNLKLLPDEIFVREIESKYEIPPSQITSVYTLEGQTHWGEKIIQDFQLSPCVIEVFKLEKAKIIIGTIATLIWEIKDCVLIQIQFSDSPLVINVSPAESKYSFQAITGRIKVKLTAWGATNIVQQEIPIETFQSPKLNSLIVPVLNISLEIRWIPPPRQISAPVCQQLSTLISKTSKHNKSLLWCLIRSLSFPSEKVLKFRMHKFSVMKLSPEKLFLSFKSVSFFSMFFDMYRKLSIQYFKENKYD